MIIPDDFPGLARAILNGPEFRHYADHKKEILKRVEGNRERFDTLESTELVGAQYQLRTNTVAVRSVLLRVVLYAPFLVAAVVAGANLVAASPAEVAAQFGAARSNDWFVANNNVVGTVVVLAAMVMWLRLTTPMVTLLSRRQVINSDRRRAQAAWEQQREGFIREELAKAINDLLGPRGVVAFPTYAPRLVELDTSTIAPSTTYNQVSDFILGHESTAIGLAGSRGSGKSTVLRALSRSADFEPFVTVVSSPVKYDPGEFLRRLLYEVATTINQRASDIDDKVGRGSKLKGWLLGLAGLAGMAIIVAKAVPLGPMFSKIDYLLVAGYALVGIAVLGALGAMARRVSEASRKLPADVAKARELLQVLQWEVERGTNIKKVLKVHTFLEGSAENTLKHKSRTMTHADLVVALHELLQLFAKNNPNKRLVVCIDELDKLDQPGHLVSVVNELKDVFHIRGVHFVVTVSTDALRSFESRGLPDRDAFDSAFDTVISTRWLTMEESVKVIVSRAAGFASLIAQFCHAWSGGLVRDLLRAARKAVELQKASERPLTVGEIVSDLVFDDLLAATQASLRGLDSADKDVAALWELHCLLDKARERKAVDMTALTFDTEAFDVLKAKAQLGIRLVGLARWADTHTALGDELALVGAAMGKIDGPKPMRDDAVATVVPPGPAKG